MSILAVLLLINSTVIAGETKLVGPTSAKRGELVTITVQTDEELIDSKLTPFSSNNAKVLNEYRLLKDPKTNELVIILFTNTPDKYAFTFSSAAKVTEGAKETVKTIALTHVVDIVGDGPIIPGPTPVPVPPGTSDLEKALQAAFTADTNAAKIEQLKALVTIMTNVKTENAAGTLDNLGKVQFSLRTNTDNLLKADSLKPMRAAITAFLMQELGRDAKLFSKDKVNAAFEAIIVSLNKVK